MNGIFFFFYNNKIALCFDIIHLQSLLLLFRFSFLLFIIKLEAIDLNGIGNIVGNWDVIICCVFRNIRSIFIVNSNIFIRRWPL